MGEIGGSVAAFFFDIGGTGASASRKQHGMLAMPLLPELRASLPGKPQPARATHIRPLICGGGPPVLQSQFGKVFQFFASLAEQLHAGRRWHCGFNVEARLPYRQTGITVGGADQTVEVDFVGTCSNPGNAVTMR